MYVSFGVEVYLNTLCVQLPVQHCCSVLQCVAECIYVSLGVGVYSTHMSSVCVQLPVLDAQGARVALATVRIYTSTPKRDIHASKETYQSCK